MSDSRHEEDAANSPEEHSSRPPPRNPFLEADPLDDEQEPLALIDSRKSAAISGVIVGLIALILVVALCVTASYAFR